MKFMFRGTLTVTGRLCILESEIVAESADIGYDPNDTGDWNTTPTNAKTAFDQLADRVKQSKLEGVVVVPLFITDGMLMHHRFQPPQLTMNLMMPHLTQVCGHFMTMVQIA